MTAIQTVSSHLLCSIYDVLRLYYQMPESAARDSVASVTHTSAETGCQCITKNRQLQGYSTEKIEPHGRRHMRIVPDFPCHVSIPTGNGDSAKQQIDPSKRLQTSIKRAVDDPNNESRKKRF